MRALLFFVLFLGCCSAQTCPSGYQWADGIGCVRSIDYEEYVSLDNILPWARTQCAKAGARLPMIKSKQDDDALDQLVRSYPDPTLIFVVLDLVCNGTSRSLEWADGTAMDYTPKDVVDFSGSKSNLDFDCVSTGQTATAQPTYTRWVVVGTGESHYYTVMCVIPSADVVTGTPITTRISTAPTTPWPITGNPTQPPSTSYRPPSTTGWNAPSTTGRPMTPTPPMSGDYCTCQTSTIYLDIVFVVDTSDDMTSASVKDASATIQSTLYGLTFGTGRFQSNVAAIAFAEVVQTVKNFGDFKSSKDISSFSLPYLGGNSNDMANAIKKASSMLRSSGRDFARGVIVLFSNSFDQRKASTINDATKAFKDDGGIFVTVDFSDGSGLDGLEKLSSPGYFINDTSLSNPNVDANLLYAFCDANCFCKDDLLPYREYNSRGREVASGGCYRVADFAAVYDAAKDRCESDRGFVVTVHDDDKSFFLMSLFPPKSRYWLGLQKIGGNYQWADGVYDPYTYWSSGNPIVGQDCVYSQQQSGFNTRWFSAPCSDPLKNSMPYACQLRPCSSEYDCWE